MRTRLYPSSRKWLLAEQNRTDRERAQFACKKMRRYLDCWEVLRMARGRWLTMPEIRQAVPGNYSPRLVRRTLEHLASTGYVELQRGTPPGHGRTPSEGRARMVKPMAFMRGGK
jgi:hypothetical protein